VPPPEWADTAYGHVHLVMPYSRRRWIFGRLNQSAEPDTAT
jgi:hypothetical protein